jgi:hypothetical protein
MDGHRQGIRQFDAAAHTGNIGRTGLRLPFLQRCAVRAAFLRFALGALPSDTSMHTPHTHSSVCVVRITCLSLHTRNRQVPVAVLVDQKPLIAASTVC